MGFLYRDIQIEDDKTLGDSGTTTVDLNVLDPITELMLRFRVLNEAAHAHNAIPETVITKIELVDGGQVYYSLYGECAVAAACFDTGKWPYHQYDDYQGCEQFVHIPIRFGRYLGDTEYAFNPRAFKNPQLKFTWANSSHHLTAETKLGVTAKVMDGQAAPPEFLAWQEVETFTSVGEGVKRVEMPVDRLYRRMLIRSYHASEASDTIINHLKLDLDLGKLIPFDLDYSEWKDQITGEFGPYIMRMRLRVTQSEAKQTWMQGNTMIVASEASANQIVNLQGSSNNYVVAYAFDTDNTALTDIATEVGVWGFFPHSVWPYQFGRPDAPETWFSARDYGRVDLKLTQGVAAGEVTVAVQSPVRP